MNGIYLLCRCIYIRSRDHSADNFIERKEWGLIFRDYRAPIEHLQAFATAALQHVAICLGATQPKPSPLPEELLRALPGPIPSLGSPGFTAYFKDQVSFWHQSRSRILNNWEQRRSARTGQGNDDEKPRVPHLSKHDQEQLLVILYLQHLFHGLLDCVQDLLVYAEEHDVRRHPKQLILPGRRKFIKMIHSLVKADGVGEHPADTHEGPTAVLYPVPSRLMGTADAHPEYLKPKNAWQRFGRQLRRVSSFLSSSQSLFGLRVACAVMSVAIIALLADTSAFFFRQRLIWAVSTIVDTSYSTKLTTFVQMIIIAFSMNATSGASFSTFMYRLVGSISATVVSMINWYIVDGHPAGVLVMYWLFNVVITYFSIKYPQYAAVWRIHMITTTIMVRSAPSYETRHVAILYFYHLSHTPLFPLRV